MSNIQMPFILTLDASVASRIKEQGFKLISNEGERFVFENTKSLTFQDIDKAKVCYTNILFM